MEEKLNEKAEFNNDLNNYQKNRINKIRRLFSNVYDYIENECNQSRETSLAITKLEEAQFWTIKGITREEWKVKRNT